MHKYVFPDPVLVNGHGFLSKESPLWMVIDLMVGLWYVLGSFLPAAVTRSAPARVPSLVVYLPPSFMREIA